MRALGVQVLLLLVLLTAGFLVAAGLLGVLADRLGLVAQSGLSVGALSSGGVVFLVLGFLLVLTSPFLLRRRSGAWTLAMLVALIGMLWSFYSIARAIAVFHVEWDTAAAMSAILTGYLPTVRRFFRPIDLE
jgi:hypothetical protein